MSAIVSRRVVVRVWSASVEGVTVKTHRRLGERLPHAEIVSDEVEREKERKRLKAQAARNRRYAEKFKEY